MKVRPKKYLGQHFLSDNEIANRIVDSFSIYSTYGMNIEVGPGMGVLTKRLIERFPENLILLEIDSESVKYLKENFSIPGEKIVLADFLKHDLNKFGASLGIIGNFPYNISSQIFFKVLDHHDRVMEVVGMVQKEVADRICASSGNKTYGILSVLLSVYYDIEYLFTVEPYVFIPPPKVKSAVIRLKRNDVDKINCDEKLFKKIVKQGFQNRRKTLRNALKALNLPDEIVKLELLNLRAEQLTGNDYIELTRKIELHWTN